MVPNVSHLFTTLQCLPFSLMQSLADSPVNGTLVEVVPLLKQSFFQMISVTDLAAVHSIARKSIHPSFLTRRIVGGGHPLYLKF